jgi:hypothetical protein
VGSGVSLGLGAGVPVGIGVVDAVGKGVLLGVGSGVSLGLGAGVPVGIGVLPGVGVGVACAILKEKPSGGPMGFTEKSPVELCTDKQAIVGLQFLYHYI